MIPRTRDELLDHVVTSFWKLRAKLDEAGPRAAGLVCVDDWTVKDLLEVRLWWTNSVVDWIEEGRRGGSPVTPAPGYAWRETPRLNRDLVNTARRRSYRSTRARLERALQRVPVIIEALDDRELLEAGVYAWAGKWPLSRWLSINTARQYVTARAYLRKALRARDLSS